MITGVENIFWQKRILLIFHSGSLGGAERQGLGLSKILTEDYDCEVSLLLSFSKEMQPDFKEFAKVCHIKNIFHSHSPYLVCWKEISYKNLKRLVWSIKYIMGYRKILKPYKFDYIFPFLNFPSKLAFYLYKALPTVKFTFWHQLGLDVFKPEELFEKYASRATPAIIANSQTGLDLYDNFYGLDKNKSYVLHQYLTMEYVFFDKKQLRDKYNIPQGVLVFGMVAHYRKEKLHDIVIEAFRKVALDYPNTYFIFLGNKESSVYTKSKFDRLKNKIQEFNLDNRMFLLSQRPVEEILSILDVGILMSEIEGLPNVVMEYMLYSLPVICTNHQGCNSLIANPDFLIENDVEILYKKMLELYLDRETRQIEGAANKENILHFTKERYITALSQIIRRHC